MDLDLEAIARQQLVGGRYELGAVLGRGGNSIVFRGRDVETGHTVAVKLIGPLPSADERVEAVLRFKSEATLLRRLDHPGIVRVLDWGEHETAAYLVMTKAPGESLHDVLEREGSLRPSEVLRIARLVGSALQHAHEASVVHRDLKPHNISMLRCEEVDGTCELQVQLLDFGLAILEDGAVRGEVAGTYSYMAPEQIGVFDRLVDARADLYSLGVVLYQLLTGRLPFKAASLRQLVYQHLARRCPPIEAAPGAPQVLAGIVTKLLEKDPDDRYDSAGSLLFDLERIDALAEAFVESGPRSLGRSSEPVLRQRTRLIGRDEAVRDLVEAVEASARGRGRVVLVAGPAQSGKRRLLEVAREAVLIRRGNVLVGRAAGQGAAPFGPLLAAVRSHLAVRARTDPEGTAAASERIRSLLQGWADPILEALPQLVRSGHTAGGERPDRSGPLHPVLEPMLERRRMVEAVARLLSALGEPGRHTVLLLEELNEADEQTVLAVDRLARHRGAVGITVVAAVDSRRSGHAADLLRISRHGSSGSIGVVLRLQQIEVGPLDPTAAADFIEAQLAPLGAVNEAIVDSVLAHVDERLPGCVEATIHGWVERGAIRREPGSDELVFEADLATAGGVDRSRRLIDRINTEPDLVRRLGRLSLLRRAFSLRTAKVALDGDGLVALETLYRGERLGVLRREREPTGFYAFGSERIRTWLKADLSADVRVETAQRLAAHLVSLPAGSGERSANEIGHLERLAGRTSEAIPWLVEAGDTARMAGAFGAARAAYAQVTQPAVLVIAPPGFAFRARFGLGEALLGLGKYGRALSAFKEALPRCGTALERARTLVRLGAASYRSGDGAASLDYLGRALQGIAAGMPGSRPGVFLRLASAGLRQVVHTFLPTLTVGRAGPITDEVREQLRVFRELEYALFFVDSERCLLSLLRSLNLAERYQPSHELGLTLATHAIGCGIVGMFARSHRFLDRAVEVGQFLRNDEAVLAEATKCRGVIQFWEGRHQASLETLRRAEALFERRYDPFSLNLVRTYLGLSELASGNLDEAHRAFSAQRELGRLARDERGIGVGLIGGALVALENRSPEISLDLAQRAVGILERIGDNMFHGVALTTLGRAQLELGQHAEAVDTLREARRLFDVHRVRGMYPIGALAALAEALVADMVRLDELTDRARRKRAREARRLATRAVKEGRSQPVTLPRALIALARVERALGATPLALGALREACAVARNQGAEHLLAAAELELGRTLLPLDANRAQGLLVAASNRYRRMGASTRLREIERLAPDVILPSGIEHAPEGTGSGSIRGVHARLRKFESVVEVGETLIGERRLDHLLARVVETAMEVTGAERGFLLMYEELDPKQVADDDSGVLRRDGRARRLRAEVVRAAEGEAAPLDTEATPHALGLSHTVLEVLDASGEPLLLQDAAQDPRLRDHASVVERGLRSVLCVPLAGRGAPIGLIYLDSRLVRGLFGEGDIPLLATFAVQAALAIEEARTRDELERANHDLREARAELVQSAKMSAVGQLAAGLSHEIRNPLNIMRGQIYMLREQLQRGAPAADCQRYLKNVDEEIVRATDLLDNLLSFSRPATELERVDVNEVAARAHDLVGELGRRCGVEVVAELGEGLPELAASASQLQQVLVNILLNAVESIPQDEPGRVVISTIGGADEVRIVVRDSGCGMGESVRERIFEPFFTSRATGTGLGLYVCYGIIEQHQGRIEVESTPGEGTTFTVILPRAADPDSRLLPAPLVTSAPA